MPFAFLIFGLVLLIAAFRGKHDDLIDLLKDDFTGSSNFFVWVMAIVFLIALGNIERIKPVTDAFLLLVILVIVLANKGLFEKFTSELKAGTQ